MEKTFDELIKENEFTPRGYNRDIISVVNSMIVKDLLKQVREATIAECKTAIDKTSIKLYQSEYQELDAVFDNIKTDRILITENEE